jgi:hypothetical protein
MLLDRSVHREEPMEVFKYSNAPPVERGALLKGYRKAAEKCPEALE